MVARGKQQNHLSQLGLDLDLEKIYSLAQKFVCLMIHFIYMANADYGDSDLSKFDQHPCQVMETKSSIIAGLDQLRNGLLIMAT